MASEVADLSESGKYTFFNTVFTTGTVYGTYMHLYHDRKFITLSLFTP